MHASAPFSYDEDYWQLGLLLQADGHSVKALF